MHTAKIINSSLYLLEYYVLQLSSRFSQESVTAFALMCTLPVAAAPVVVTVRDLLLSFSDFYVLLLLLFAVN